MRPGQVHPTARSLGSHRALPVQLNFGLQLLSTVSGTKMARHSCPFCFGKRVAIVRARLHSLRKNSLPTPMRPGQVHPTARSLGSHRALPVQLNFGLQLLSTVSGTKMARHSCPFCFGKRVAIVRARLHSLRKNSLPTPMRPGQVHPTARSLGSHRALPVQLNSGLQLHSTVSETKMALLRSPSLRQIGGNAGRTFTVR